MSIVELRNTIKDIAQPGKGILAADESFPTIKKRFNAIGIESTEETRQAYRELLFTTPNLCDYISGVILFEETLQQRSKDGVPFSNILSGQGIVPGVKVDKGTVDLENCPENKITQGLDGLNERLLEYKKQGARFAKWRAVFSIGEHNPMRAAIKSNAYSLARYAAICQNHGIVPIVEPEVLMDGDHNIQTCAEVTNIVLHAVLHALHKQKVILEYIILKPSMVISGAKCQKQAGVQEVAEETLRILRETVPAAVPTINFLSGGQSAQKSTAHLNAMNLSATVKPWNLSFSYGRALQDPCLKAWLGKADNVEKAQAELFKRAKLNSAACSGEYSVDME